MRSVFLAASGLAILIVPWIVIGYGIAAVIGHVPDIGISDGQTKALGVAALVLGAGFIFGQWYRDVH